MLLDTKAERNWPTDFGFEEKDTELSPYSHVPSCLLGLKPQGECNEEEIIFVLHFLSFLLPDFYYSRVIRLGPVFI